MTEHYYSEKPGSKSQPLVWHDQLRNHHFTFTTDRSVFSRRGVDFGSKLLLETFVAPKIKGPVLDVGCGYGPIGLSIARSYPGRIVHMIDINERALRLAEKNARDNEVANVKIYYSHLFENVVENHFAAIVTNPPIRAGKKTVHTIFLESYSHLQKEGELWVVIQKKQGAPSARKKLEEIFGNVDVVRREKGFFIFRSIKI